MKKLIDENKLLLENAHIESENMIKWVIAARRKYVRNLRSKLYQIKSKIEVVLTKTNLCQELCSSEPRRSSRVVLNHTSQNLRTQLLMTTLFP